MPRSPVDTELYERESATMRALSGLPADEPITYNDIGWDSRVYMAHDGEIVFKFARTEETANQFALESSILETLEALDLPCRIPRVRWRGVEGTAYLGYLGIPGVDLSTCIGTLAASERHRIGVAVGGFLRILHEQTLDHAPTVTAAADIEDYRSKFAIVAPTLEQFCTPEERAAIRTFLDDVLAPGLAAATEARVLTHGDLGPWNIVIGPEGEIGVIDFGDVCFHHRSKDFWTEDAAYAGGLLDAYGADASLRDLISLRSRAFPLYDLPYYIGKGMTAEVIARIDVMRTMLHSGPSLGPR